MTTLNIQDDGLVRTIWLNRPEARNALTRELRLALADALNAPAQMRAIFLRGQGGHFCSGQDLKEFAAMNPAKFSAENILNDEYKPVLDAIDKANCPVIAVVEGACVGAGMSFALACDFVIAAQSAYFQLSFSSIALSPDAGISYILPRLVGQANAIAMAQTGQKVSATHAHHMGMVWNVLEDHDLEDEVQRLRDHFANSAPISQRNSRRLMRSSFAQTAEESFALEAKLQDECAHSADFMEAVGAFIQKRAPKFKGN